MNAPDRVASAKEYAREQVAWYRSNSINFLGVPIRLLNSDDSERLAAQVFAHQIMIGAIDPAYAAQEAKAGDPLFYDALCRLAAAELGGGLQLAEPLRSLVINILQDPPKITRARRRETNFLRDVGLTMLVQDISERFELPATGSSARRASACGIVAEAMKMESETVRKAISKFINQI